MASAAVFLSSSPPRLASDSRVDSPTAQHARRRGPAWNLFAPAAPSSPTQLDGELSPTFDASFTSGMSLTTAADTAHLSTSEDGMDISPAPLRRLATEPAPARSPAFGSSFLKTLSAQHSRSASPALPALSPTSRPHSAQGAAIKTATAPLSKRSTLPALSLSSSQERRSPKHRTVRSLGQSPSYEAVLPAFKPPTSLVAGAPREKRSSGTARSKLDIPREWSAHKMLPPPPLPLKRHTDMPPRPPLSRADVNQLQRQSDSALPTMMSSPSVAMDVDPRSPERGEAPADLVAIGEAWEVASPLPAAMPATRKRSLVDELSSPSSASAGRDSSPLSRPQLPRLFERGLSTNAITNATLARRRGSRDTTFGSHGKRPSLGGPVASFHGASGVGVAGIDEQQPMKRVRPPFLPRSSRRTQSSIEVSTTNGIIAPRVPTATGIGQTSQAIRPASLAVPTRPGGNYFAAETSQRAVSEIAPPLVESPSAAISFAGAFGCNEHDHKALPCFSVTDDGLMRITSDTLVDVLHGKYDALILDYVIVDCRFDYEFEGGHIAGAINLQTESAVEDHFLHCAEHQLPAPSRSGQPDGAGSTRKSVIIFHCEFSCKRAPTMAKHLRSRDRALNSAHYPDVHYPELYVLQGGYAEVHTKFEHVCEPRGYVRMDDPAHLVARHSELNKFRQRQALNQRAKSFTFGEHISAVPQTLVPTVRPTSALARVEDGEDAGADRSFGTSSDDGPSETSPCPPANSKIVVYENFLIPPRRGPMSRAATTTRL